MNKRKILGIILLVLVAVVLFYAFSLLLREEFKAYRLINLLAFSALTVHWYGLWILMKFENQNNHILNLVGQGVNFISGMVGFLLLISGNNIDVYWNWLISLGIFGLGWVVVFLSGAFETQFRLLPWINSFIVVIWVFFSIYIFVEQVKSELFYNIMLGGWLLLVVSTTTSILTSPRKLS